MVVKERDALKKQSIAPRKKAVERKGSNRSKQSSEERIYSNKERSSRMNSYQENHTYQGKKSKKTNMSSSSNDIEPTERPQKRKQKRKQKSKRNNHSKQKKVLEGLYNLLFYVLVLSIIGGSILFTFSEKTNSSLFGYRFYTVLTNSMKTPKGASEKGFSAGDIVFVKLMDRKEIKVGDVVTFQVGDGERYLTHRVMEQLDELNGEVGDYVITKGDANRTNDPPIEASRIIGKVDFVIPKAGRILTFIRENIWLCLVFVSALFGFIVVLKSYFFGDLPNPSKKKKRKKSKKASNVTRKKSGAKHAV